MIIQKVKSISIYKIDKVCKHHRSYYFNSLLDNENKLNTDRKDLQSQQNVI